MLFRRCGLGGEVVPYPALGCDAICVGAQLLAQALNVGIQSAGLCGVGITQEFLLQFVAVLHFIRTEEDEMDMRNGILYLNLLNETRAMVRHSFALLQDQSELFRSHT